MEEHKFQPGLLYTATSNHSRKNREGKKMEVQRGEFPWGTRILRDPAVENPGFQLQGLAAGLTYNAMEKAGSFFFCC